MPEILAHWGAIEVLRRDPAFAGVDSASLTFEALYVAAARAAPTAAFAQYNSVDDATQLRFLAMLGVRDARFGDVLAENLADIRRASPRFHSYTGPGDGHALLAQPEFYAVAVDGVALRDWVAGLLRGARVTGVGQDLLEGGLR